MEEETEKYQPPEVRLRSALQGVGGTPPPYDRDRPTSYDLWSAGVLFLEIILGTDRPFSLQPREDAMIERALAEYPAGVRKAVALLQGLEDYCVVPDARAMSTWLAPLRGTYGKSQTADGKGSQEEGAAVASLDNKAYG